MAGHSPSRRKRNDFTDFFRTSTSSTPSQRELVSATDLLAPPSESEQDASGGYLSPPEGSKTIKKVSTKIPFLGRSRKKSTPSVKSGVVSDAPSNGYESTDFGESSKAALKKSRRFSQPAFSPENSTASQATTSSHLFFPTRLAAHFAKSKKPAKIPKEDSSRATLNVPTDTRPVSFDSDTSESSLNRSSTPRPTITLSPSPDARPDDFDNVDEFEDLFTRSKYAKKDVSSHHETTTPASQYRDMFHDGDSSITLTPARRNVGQLALSPAETVSDIARREARELAERSSKCSKLRLPNTLSPRVIQSESHEDSADESVRSGSVSESPSASAVNRAKSLSPATSPRSSRLRTKSATTTGKLPSKPPNIPLPLPPSPKTKPPTPPVLAPPASDKPLPLAPSRAPSRNTGNGGSPGRRRALTDGSLPPSLLKREAAIKSASNKPSSKPSTPESGGKIPPSRSSADKENLDVESLTPEQTKEALLKRIRRVEELEDQMAEMSRTHTLEKAALEKRVRVLELDIHKRTNENRALVRILQSRVDGRSKSSETDTGSVSSTKYGKVVASGSLPPRSASSNADDSGVESYATSGGESSLHGSTSIRKKAQRPLILSDALYRSSLPSSKVPTKRESLYSLSSTSATSSASSLIPPSPSISGSPLSAILESPSATSASKIGTVTKSRTTPIMAGESLSDDDRRLSRISRFSTSSSASSLSISTSAATSSYSQNLRRGRPPSIAQVMEKGGIDGHFDKIHIAGVTQAISTPYTP